MNPLLPTLLLASACPNLVGNYHCVLPDGKYSLLKIKQELISKKNEPEVVQYSIDYVAVPGEPDVFRASSTGVMDEFGWLNRCEKGRIVSISNQQNAESEIYLDSEHAFVGTYNGKVTAHCPKGN